MKQVGILLSGVVDMVKEDLWGNKTMLLRMQKEELFGETFACGEDSMSVVTFIVSEDAKILWIPFEPKISLKGYHLEPGMNLRYLHN